MANHLKFVARTVMVPNGNVEAAYRMLNRVLTMDGVIEEAKRHQYHEKPCRRRQREVYETCRRIYNMEMARKINFLMRKNRLDPWLGSVELPRRVPPWHSALLFRKPSEQTECAVGPILQWDH